MEKEKVILLDPNDVRSTRCRVARSQHTLRQSAPDAAFVVFDCSPFDPPISASPLALSAPQAAPFSSDYPYRPPRIDDGFFQAALPPRAGATAAAGFLAKDKGRRPARVVARLKEALSRVTASSAFAGPPETSVWDPKAALASNSAEARA